MRYARSKYGVRTDAAGIEARTADNIVFDSLKEKNRYLELKASQKSGLIYHLEVHAKFPLHASPLASPNMGGAEKISHYEADFVYISFDGRTVVEDCKGMKTAMYRLKKRWFEVEYGIRILET